MAKDHGSSVKNDKQYEGLRKKGMSKSRAAAISNSPGLFEPRRHEQWKQPKPPEQRQRKRRQQGAEGGGRTQGRKEIGQLVEGLRRRDGSPAFV